jgi:hypothetical protein
MQTSTCDGFACSKCRFFQPDGRYHGNCDRMNVSVQGEWRACHLAIGVFDPLPFVTTNMKIAELSAS